MTTDQLTLADLDRWCAEFMEWKVVAPPRWWSDDEAAYLRPDGTVMDMADWHPTEDANQADEVLGAWLNGGGDRDYWGSGDKDECLVTLSLNGQTWQASAPTLREAICRAVYAAEGGER